MVGKIPQDWGIAVKEMQFLIVFQATNLLLPLDCTTYSMHITFNMCSTES
jgi:hypothetical protein